jgi:hypothetical protein
MQDPLTNREYAYVFISGAENYTNISTTLELKPSEAWNVGDVDPRSGRVRKNVGWRLDSGLDDKQPLAEHIQALLAILGTRREALRLLWEECDLVLQCVGYYPTSGHGAHLDREMVRRAANFGLAIDLDFYFVEPSSSGI